MSNASLELGGDNWAAKDGNLLGYAVGDSSGKYVPREFTFTRGSNLAATRVAANGLIEKGRENLLLQSNQFDTTWTLNATSVTSGQAGYDGSNDAWLLNSTTTGFPRIQQNVTSSGVATYSVYVKPATDGFINMRTFGASGSQDAAVWFNLNDGVVVNASGSQYVSSKIESVGDGWYRCSVIVNGSLTSLRIYPASSYGNYSTSGNGVYIQDAQLEAGMVATDYIETGATTVQAGLLEDEPRIDYTGGTGSLLLEPSRTQFIPYTEYLDVATNWSSFPTSNPVTHTQNYAISPDGTQTASLLGNFTSAGFNIVNNSNFRTTTLVTQNPLDDTYNMSIWLKTTSGTGTISLLNRGLSSGTNSPQYIQCNVTNEWQRFDVSNTYTAAENASSLGLIIIKNVTDTLEEVLVWGAQVEQASYPTSYIPNHSGGSVTRDADSMNSPNSVVGATDNYTIFFDISNDKANTASGGNSQWLKGRNSSDFNIWTLRKNNVADQKYHSLYFNEDSDYVFTNQTINKACFVFTSSEIKVFLDGSLNTTYSVTNSPLGLDDFLITYGSSDRTNIVLSQFLLFPTALSDAQCSALTVEGLKEEILTSYIAAVDTLEDGAEARLDTYLQNLEELIV